MAKPRDELVARFGVGTADGPRSAVWRIWTQKGTSDVYIAARAHGGDVKVSLHQSGDWRFAFDYVFWNRRASPGGDNRVIESWNPPPPINGLTPAFMVIVPSGELDLPRHPLTEKAKSYTRGVTWVPPAPEGFATHFIVTYADPGVPVPDEYDRLVDPFRLPSGKTVSILMQEYAISEGEKQQLEAARQYLASMVRQGPEADRAALETWLEPRTWLFTANEYGTRSYIDISQGATSSKSKSEVAHSLGPNRAA